MIRIRITDFLKIHIIQMAIENKKSFVSIFISAPRHIWIPKRQVDHLSAGSSRALYISHKAYYPQLMMLPSIHTHKRTFACTISRLWAEPFNWVARRQLRIIYLLAGNWLFPQTLPVRTKFSSSEQRNCVDMAKRSAKWNMRGREFVCVLLEILSLRSTPFIDCMSQDWCTA